MTDSNADQNQIEFNPPPGSMLGVSVGNTTTRLALIEGLDAKHVRSAPSEDPEAISAAAREIVELAETSPPDGVLLASVNRQADASIAEALGQATGLYVQRFGPELPIPIATDVHDRNQVGQDRLLAALGAFAVGRQACIVVDAGTAITVDFVDGQGVFHGGAIIPGGQMMLNAMHEHTDALPDVSLADMPDPLEPFGKSTASAMLLGVRGAARGAVRYLAERYADYYEAYPQIIATGGDAETLLAGDELIEHIAPDLVLVGIAAARARFADDPEES